MRILYLSSSYIPSRRASSVHVMKMCSAMARQGHRVVLACKQPAAADRSTVSDYESYGITESFEIVKLSRPRLRGGGLIFAAELAAAIRRRHLQTDLVYSRDVIGAFLATRRRQPTCFEVHGPPPPGLGGSIYRSVLGSPSLVRLVVISEALRCHLEDLDLLPGQADIILAPDAADPMPMVETNHTPSDSGRRLRVGYVGSMYPGRGIELILELARRVQECDFDLVGGTEKDLERLCALDRPSNVTFHGFVEHARLETYYSLLDVLLMPYQKSVLAFTGRSDISRWFSPMKMFEYMAAGRPVVASDLPVLREVLREGENALLVGPDDVEEWTSAIRRLASSPSLRRRLAQTGLAQFRARHTWEARANSVLADLGE